MPSTLTLLVVVPCLVMVHSLNEPGYLVKCEAANENKNSACLDGSPQTFYYRPGSNESAHKFHIYFQGGGWCSGIDDTTGTYRCWQTCYKRATSQDPDQTSRGSSSMDPTYLVYPKNNYLSDDPTVNPLSWDWNTVFVRYCDGASFSGNNDSEILTTDGVPLYFKGFNNLNAVLDMLRDEYGLLDATNVLLTGSSAGGLSVYLHADYIASYIGVNDDGKDINFMAMPDSGWFVDPDGEDQFEECMEWIFEAQNTSIALNRECMEQHEEGHKCIFAQYVTPYIESKLMAIQSRFDKWQIRHKEDEAEINAYGQWLGESMMEQFVHSNQKKARERMLFLDSCEHHVFATQWTGISIDGFTAARVQLEFWFRNSSDYEQNLYFQNESYPCNGCCDVEASLAPSMSPTTSTSTSSTMAPTASPSMAPTTTVSMAPTATPSKAPSASSSMAPTTTPSMAPIATPSMAPTTTPSKAPSASSSKAPTASSSTAPSALPSMAPTAASSVKTITVPTMEPTTLPTMEPTTPPSVAPIKSPNNVDGGVWNQQNDAKGSNAAGMVTIGVLLSVLAVLCLVGGMVYMSWKHLHPDAYNIKGTALEVMVSESSFGADETNGSDLGTEMASRTGKTDNVEMHELL